MTRRAPAAFFALVLVAFALPFATVVPSCSSDRVDVTGYDLALRDVEHRSYEAAHGVEESGFALAFAALVLAVAGIVLAAAGRLVVAQLVVAALGVQSLHLEFYALWLDAGDVDLHAGWLTAVVAFAAAGAVSIVALRRQPRAFAPPLPPAPEDAGAAAAVRT